MKSFNNTRLLTQEEYDFYKNKYEFILFEDKVAVKVKGFNRVTLHSFDETFSINAIGSRKMSFRPEAMKIWKELKEDNNEYNLIDIQQAVNKLYITFQKVDKENVLNILNGKDIKIKVDEIK